MRYADNTFSKKSDHRIDFISKSVSVLLGLVPWLRIRSTNAKPNLLQWLYFSFVLLTVFYWVVMTVFREYILQFFRPRISLTTFAIISAGTLAFINVLVVMSVHLWKYKSYNTLLTYFSNTDDILNKYIIRNMKLDKLYYLKILLAKVIIPLVCATIHTYLAFISFWGLGIEALQKYHIVFTVIIVRHYIEQINCRYEAVGNVLLRNLKPDLISCETEVETCLFDMIECVIKLEDQVGLINDIYGWFFVVLMVHNVCCFQYYFITTIVFYRYNIGLEYTITIASWVCLSVVSK